MHGAYNVKLIKTELKDTNRDGGYCTELAVENVRVP